MIRDIKEEEESSKLRRAVRSAAGAQREEAHALSDNLLMQHALAKLAPESHYTGREE